MNDNIYNNINNNLIIDDKVNNEYLNFISELKNYATNFKEKLLSEQKNIENIKEKRNLNSNLENTSNNQKLTELNYESNKNDINRNKFNNVINNTNEGEEIEEEEKNNFFENENVIESQSNILPNKGSNFISSSMGINIQKKEIKEKK